MSRDDEETDLKIQELTTKRYERVRKEVEEAYPPLINALAVLVDYGPREDSKWTKREFNLRVKRLLDDFSDLFEEAFGPEEENQENR